MSSAFDPQAFLDAQTTEVNTKRPPIPTENPEDSNGLYTAIIGEVTTGSGIINKGDKAGKPWASMVIPLKIEVPKQFQDSLGFGPVLTITDRVFLDLSDSGQIDNGPGKNRGQKAYRDATGLNVPGQPFSWRMVTGKVIKVKITHEMYNGEPQEKIGQILPV